MKSISALITILPLLVSARPGAGTALDSSNFHVDDFGRLDANGRLYDDAGPIYEGGVCVGRLYAPTCIRGSSLRFDTDGRASCYDRSDRLCDDDLTCGRGGRFYDRDGRRGCLDDTVCE